MTVQTLNNHQLIMNIAEPSSEETQSISQSFDDWTFDMNAQEVEATDKVLEYLIQSGARPHVQATGDIVDVVTSITNILTQSVPPHLSHPLKVMTDYIARWLCDYVEKTNIGTMHINFGFDAKIMAQEGIT